MPDIDTLLEKYGGIRLDIGGGGNPQQGFVNMDYRDLPGVDIVHNWDNRPWPLPDESVLVAVASHVVEHVNPANGNFIQWMDEVWRILKPGGEFAIAVPHGRSSGYLQDPTHCNPCNQDTWYYFTPGHPYYNIYKPKPWALKFRAWSPTANIEVVLVKLEEADGSED